MRKAQGGIAAARCTGTLRAGSSYVRNRCLNSLSLPRRPFLLFPYYSSSFLCGMLLCCRASPSHVSASRDIVQVRGATRPVIAGSTELCRPDWHPMVVSPRRHETVGREPHSVLSIYTHARTQHAARTHAQGLTSKTWHAPAMFLSRQFLRSASTYLPDCASVLRRANRSVRKLRYTRRCRAWFFRPSSRYLLATRGLYDRPADTAHTCWLAGSSGGSAETHARAAESRALTPLECPPSAPPLRAVLRRSEMFRQTPCSARHRVPAQPEVAAFAWFQKAADASSHKTQDFRQDSRRELTKKTLRRWTRGAERGPAAPQERECCTARMWRQSYTSWYQD